MCKTLNTHSVPPATKTVGWEKVKCICQTEKIFKEVILPLSLSSLFAAGMQGPISAPQGKDMYSNIYGGLLTENIFTFDSLGAHRDTYWHRKA